VKFLFSQLAYFLSQGEVRRNIGALLRYVVVLVALIALYTVIFHVIMARVEGQQHSWLSGLYWTLVVMSTLGFGDITFQSDIGRLFSIVVLLSGILLLLILLPFVFIRFFYAPWLESRIRMRAPRRVHPGLSGHVILSSWDDLAPGLVERFLIHNIPWVVVEADPAAAGRMHDEGLKVIAGDVESSETWANANVTKARMVVANLEDTINTNITLTVRELAPRVAVTALVRSVDSIDVLELSGADIVLPLPQRLGEQLANRATAGNASCHIVGRFGGLGIAEFPVHNTPLQGRSIRDTHLREAIGVSIIGVWERARLVPARPDLVLSDHSVPVVIGTPQQIERLDELLAIYDANPNPVLVLGGGRVGRAASRALRRVGTPVHIVERNDALLGRIGDAADRAFIGDAADRDVLTRAGLDGAPTVLLTTHDDATNIYLTIYCRRLKPDVRLVSRITHAKNVDAVIRAGADFVLSYAQLGVDSILAALLGNDLVVLGEGVHLFRIPLPGALAGVSLVDSAIGARTGLNVIAIERPDSDSFQPAPGDRLQAADTLVVVGSAEQRQAFAGLWPGAGAESS
jgi:Trk K+ transport system NAD-binding subunit